ncbi:MAG: hypothetical protein ICCCNLDF_02845 [Planctomycetes bacterium]|nr:hypothetical protein [Planctomycetota bacterium]
MQRPRRISGRTIQVGNLAIGTIECALLLGLQISIDKSGHRAPWQYARRALAAWLHPDEWDRVQGKLRFANRWNVHSTELVKKRLVRVATSTGAGGEEITRAEPTAAGQAVIALLRELFEPPMRGDAFIEYAKEREKIAAQASAERARKEREAYIP